MASPRRVRWTARRRPRSCSCGAFHDWRDAALDALSVWARDFAGAAGVEYRQDVRSGGLTFRLPPGSVLGGLDADYAVLDRLDTKGVFRTVMFWSAVERLCDAHGLKFDIAWSSGAPRSRDVLTLFKPMGRVL